MNTQNPNTSKKTNNTTVMMPKKPNDRPITLPLKNKFNPKAVQNQVRQIRKPNSRGR